MKRPLTESELKRVQEEKDALDNIIKETLENMGFQFNNDNRLIVAKALLSEDTSLDIPVLVHNAIKKVSKSLL